MSYILLSSSKDARDLTRAYCAYGSEAEMAEQLIEYYEDYLTEVDGITGGVEYISDQFFEFIDKFYEELVCLVRQEGCHDLYTPYTTTWVKERVYNYLKTQCFPDDLANNMECCNLD